MGFFKDYKEELVNPIDGLSEETAAGKEEEVLTEDVKTVEDVLADIMLPQAEDVNGGDSTMDDFDEGIVDEELLYSLLGNSQQEEKAEAVEEVKAAESVSEEAEVQPEEIKEEQPPVQEQEISSTDSLTDEDKRATTVITKGTTINGSIISDCSLDVMGTINGDVECLGKLNITGRVTGNSMASEIFVDAKRLEGNINSEGAVKIAKDTVVVGDITAASGVIAGAVKGEIDVLGPVIIDSTAIIKGNIKAKAVQMNNGAVLEGFCSLSYASVDIDNIFE